jgi:hypothetical protein
LYLTEIFNGGLPPEKLLAFEKKYFGGHVEVFWNEERMLLERRSRVERELDPALS